MMRTNKRRVLACLAIPLTAAASCLIVVGTGLLFAQVEPPFECDGQVFNGCTASGCVDSTGQCASKNWVKEQRINYDYRECAGKAGECKGFTKNKLVCENFFFDQAHQGCPQNNYQCLLQTEIAACPAP